MPLVEKGLALVWVCENLQFRTGEYIKIFIYICICIYISWKRSSLLSNTGQQSHRKLANDEEKGGMEQSRMSRITTFLQARGAGGGAVRLQSRLNGVGICMGEVFFLRFVSTKSVTS